MGATEYVEAVLFGFMTAEEVRRQSVVKITNPLLLNTVGRPTPGGLYDPAMGPLDEDSPCKSCGQRAFHCPGHCGHIELVSKVYNPLLFNMLHSLIQKTCLYCFHFRSKRSEVEKCVEQLKLIAKGDVVGAKKLDSSSSRDMVVPEESEGSHISCATTQSVGQYYSQHNKQTAWDSFQFDEAMSILKNFLKQKSSKCAHCQAKNPKIIKPTFGWFHMGGMSSAHLRENIIRDLRMGDMHTNLCKEKSSSEVINDTDGFETVEIDSFTTTPYGVENSIFRGKSDVIQGDRVSQEYREQKHYFSGPLLPSQVSDIIKRLWENEAAFCSYLCDIQQGHLKTFGRIADHSMFFLEAIVVPPIKFRPAAKAGDSVMEHPHTVLLGKVLECNIALVNAYGNRAELSKIISRWRDLQQSVNVFFDSKTATGQVQKDVSGICQVLEKKEGMPRHNIMGKRVNFACRSVISPDPYLAVNEIGIPPFFALRLTYPERVTPWNVDKLRNAIINGPDIHPGATSYVDRVATVRLPSMKKLRRSISRKLPSSRGAVAQSGSNSECDFEGKIVYRHLQDGDIVLVNRQPTLHKPSIMAHVVRVLKGEKTLRMHYANCSTYNADFDGDEMNVHFPQDEIARAEAYNIVNANEQYIVPTKGDTIRGLIQDHIVSAVLITMKDTFLNYDEFNQLLYGSGVLQFAAGPGSFSCDHGRKISMLDSEGAMQPVLPAIWKPAPLWTGKQVISALLNHLTRDSAPFTVKSRGKIPDQYFASKGCRNDKKDSGTKRKEEDEDVENKLFIWKNELVRGVIDKAQFGKYGLVHTVQELYGSNIAGVLLSALGRLFTSFLQLHGFTCGVDDLIILSDYDRRRKEELEGEDVGEEVHREYVKFKGEIDPKDLLLEIEKSVSCNRESAVASLDMKMKNKLTKKGSNINKDLLLKGLLKPFPKNCISLMTITGAKGSTVNFQQISSYLGQQELEGKRVPRMVSGKTLPCFPSWDFASRSGGFITDRFLTGLRPQEYYFHCMAGREGLVDTAVKTSRSGYLQRCLVKNLEGLKVCYDYTVRDADGSVIQFYYGEDGVDVHKTSYLKNFEALANNQETVYRKFHHERRFNGYIETLPPKLEDDAIKFVQKSADVGKKELLKLLRQKYLSSLAESGEPVGVIAAQSIGEPSTQMTLNTFHLAGRGDVNVTLGIPRLQEILMTAAQVIKTPIITCPFQQWESKDIAKSVVARMKDVTVADIIDSMEVQLLPLSIHDNQVSRIYKLVINLKKHDSVSTEECEETLSTVFLRELEDAIEHHLVMLSKISGIKNFMSTSGSKDSSETGDDASDSKSQDQEIDNGDEDGEEDDERSEDIGWDVHKRKQQMTDEMDYEDGSEDDHSEDHSSGDETEEVGKEKETMDTGGDDETSNIQHKEQASQPESIDKKAKSEAKRKKKSKKKFVSKESDRSTFVSFKKLHFEVHFRFTKEPHLLLAQIAQKAAKKVYIRSSGRIHQCRMVEYDVDEKTVFWDEKKTRKREEKCKDDSAYWALKAAGVDFSAFWEMQDVLHVSRIYTNSIQAMLETYGVEAARGTIIREVKNIFAVYGVEIDYRHLSLVADYMTHTGGYRPMSRHGGIAKSLSPFLKMSFETASKFILEAASHGMTDDLETPSARICLGLPVKVGTGCFDLMQKLEF